VPVKERGPPFSDPKSPVEVPAGDGQCHHRKPVKRRVRCDQRHRHGEELEFISLEGVDKVQRSLKSRLFARALDPKRPWAPESTCETTETFVGLRPGRDCADFFSRFGELDMLVPAYAATIHKSQGSEYPAVIIPLLTQHYAMLQRNLLYTGVTRGKQLVVLVGQKKAIAIAVRNVSGRRRWSKLAEWLWPLGEISEAG
jgi:hypothetical protein